jgi:hypothetical protein
MGDDHRRGHGRGGPAIRHEGRGEARSRGLSHGARRRGCQRLKLRVGQPNEQPPVVDRDRRRHGAGLTNGRLGAARNLHVGRVRQAVADQGGLEGDDRSTALDRLANPVGELQVQHARSVRR